MSRGEADDGDEDDDSFARELQVTARADQHIWVQHRGRQKAMQAKKKFVPSLDHPLRMWSMSRKNLLILTVVFVITIPIIPTPTSIKMAIGNKRIVLDLLDPCQGQGLVKKEMELK